MFCDKKLPFAEELINAGTLLENTDEKGLARSGIIVDERGAGEESRSVSRTRMV